MKMNVFIGILIVMSISISCTEKININEVLENENEYTLRIQMCDINNSENSFTLPLNNSSKEIIELRNWFNKNSNQWNSSIDSWAQPKVFLNGKDFRLLIFNNFVVVGFNDKKGRPKQYTKEIEYKEFHFLTESLTQVKSSSN
jgi:hypothetical protein